MTETAPEVPAEEPTADETGLTRPAEDAPEPEWKAYARKWEDIAKSKVAPKPVIASDQLKALQEKAAKLDEIEAANQTELEKEQKAREAAEQRVTAATTRAVRSEVKALATGTFADAEDAVLNLGDLTRFVGDDGEIDEKSIGVELDAVLTRKPHLAKPEPTPESPRPGQPARPTETLRPGAAPAEPERATNLFDAVAQALSPHS